MISSIQYLPLVKQESFLRLKYEQEGLSVNQIAALTFSSRQTIVRYLNIFNIPLRSDDMRGPLQFGEKRFRQRIVLHGQEQAVIERARQLRQRGLSYEKIAGIMNTMGLRTKSGQALWYAKTVRQLIVRNARAI